MKEFDPRSLRVYVVTSGTFVAGRGHREVAGAAIRGGATAVQLRAPELEDDELLQLATELAAQCREAAVLFIVNDRLEVAVAAGADGVHLGQGDDLVGARDRLGRDRVLGISVTDVAQAHAATAAGADYLGATVWSTATKPEAEPHGLDGVRSIASVTRLPVVGIGGIDATNARRVLAAGAAGVAVISAVAAAPDPLAAVRELRAAVDAYTEDRAEERGEERAEETEGTGT